MPEQPQSEETTAPAVEEVLVEESLVANPRQALRRVPLAGLQP